MVLLMHQYQPQYTVCEALPSFQVDICYLYYFTQAQHFFFFTSDFQLF